MADGRDLDAAEAELLAQSAIIHSASLADVLSPLDPARPLYVHFDTDLCRTSDVPASSYPAADGPSLDEPGALMLDLAASNRIAGVSMSSWNPAMEGAAESQAVCLGLLARLLGSESIGHGPPTD